MGAITGQERVDLSLDQKIANCAIMYERALGGDIGSLSRLLSLVEEGGEYAKAVTEVLVDYGTANVIGVTGAPGAGKSTLTNSLISELRFQETNRVAVLAVDPSSPNTKGALLGDRIRMSGHIRDKNVFIRSMATRGAVGGLSAAVPGAVRLLDAVGWRHIIVETVGVGQSEVEVASFCDTAVVVLTPGLGDLVQLSKAGLMEIADVFVINKADRDGAEETRRDLLQAIQVSGNVDRRPAIVLTTAVNGEGVGELAKEIGRHRSYIQATGGLSKRKAKRFDWEVRNLVLARMLRVCEDIICEVNKKKGDLIGKSSLDPYEQSAIIYDEIINGLSNGASRNRSGLGEKVNKGK